MEESTRFIAGFALIRAVHFAACLMMLCVCVFDRAIVAAIDAETRVSWNSLARRLFLLSAPAVLISGAAWIAMIAIQMSGLPPAEALQWDVVSTVWRQTQFGHLWEMRLIFWVLATASLAFAFRRVRSISIWLGLSFGTLLTGSLAWAGHGQTGRAVGLHLAVDVTHLLVSAVWPVGLLPFGLLLWKIRRQTDVPQVRNIASLTSRFSTISLLSVVLLTVTGLVNSWILVGSFASLFSTAYGKTLLIKVALFAGMIVLGAINMLWWKPRLLAAANDAGGGPSAVRRLQINVMIEMILSILVLAAVGVLGMLPPAAEHMHHHFQVPDDLVTSTGGN